MFPAVVPTRSAISFDVSPVGDSCNIAIMRFWKSVIIAYPSKRDAIGDIIASPSRAHVVNFGDGSTPPSQAFAKVWGIILPVAYLFQEYPMAPRANWKGYLRLSLVS